MKKIVRPATNCNRRYLNSFRLRKLSLITSKVPKNPNKGSCFKTGFIERLWVGIANESSSTSVANDATLLHHLCSHLKAPRWSSDLSTLTAAPMIWRIVSLRTLHSPNGSVWFSSDSAETAEQTSSCKYPASETLTCFHINSSRRCQQAL